MDHIKNFLIETYYDNLGKDLAFRIWWTSFVIDNLGNKYAIRRCQLISIFRVPSCFQHDGSHFCLEKTA